MANHISSKKRIRSNETKRVVNRYQAKTTRNAVKTLRNTKDKEEAQKKLPVIVSMLDKLAKKSIIHKNKASNLKSKLTKTVNSL
ncbi:MAG: 30S ribosomal protein S20 [Bacteroidetes bacterium]|nr:30S ribosomal protein S20 [Bacteroidota bacterium]